MSELTDIISGEFEEALEVKNRKSLHRGIYLLLSSTVRREEHAIEHSDLKSSIIALNKNVELIILRMADGFRRMDERFEAVDQRFEAADKRFETVDKRFEVVDKRFEAVDKRFEALGTRFSRQTTLISVGFLLIATLITVFQFLR